MAPAVTGGSIEGEDASYLVKQVKAEIASASHIGLVLHTYSYFNAHQNSDGSFVHSGPKRGEGYQYIARDATSYARNWSYNKDGSLTGIIGHDVAGPVVNSTQDDTLTIINHVNHTYSQQQTEYAVTGAANAPEPTSLGLASNPSEVQQALRSRRVTQKGMTTVHGTPAIALSITVPDRTRIHLTLHVDARTYQPLRTVTVVDGNPNPYVADWMPATPDNITKATTGDSIPDGYTKVDWAG